MDINAVKTVLAKHFDRYSTKTAVASQYLGGEYWLPKHEASLRDLLDEIIEDITEQPLKESVKFRIQRTVDDIRSALFDIDSAIEDEL